MMALCEQSSSATQILEYPTLSSGTSISTQPGPWTEHGRYGSHGRSKKISPSWDGHPTPPQTASLIVRPMLDNTGWAMADENPISSSIRTISSHTTNVSVWLTGLFTPDRSTDRYKYGPNDRSGELTIWVMCFMKHYLVY